MDYGEMLKFGIRGFWDGKTIGYAALYFAISAVFTVAIFALTGISGYDFKGIRATTAAHLLMYYALTLVMALVAIPLMLKIAGNGMKAAGIAVYKDLDAPYLSGKSAIIAIRYVIVAILWVLYAVFSFKNLKFLLLLGAAIAGIVLIAVAAASDNALLVLAGIAVFVLAGGAYSVVVIYNFVRLLFIDNVFLQNPHSSLMGMFDRNWEGTQGKFWNVFIAYIVISLVAMAAFIPLFIITFVISFLSPLFADILSGLWIAGYLVFEGYAMAYVFGEIFLGKGMPQASALPRKAVKK